jgi:hypothetical protein
LSQLIRCACAGFGTLGRSSAGGERAGSMGRGLGFVDGVPGRLDGVGCGGWGSGWTAAAEHVRYLGVATPQSTSIAIRRHFSTSHRDPSLMLSPSLGSRFPSLAPWEADATLAGTPRGHQERNRAHVSSRLCACRFTDRAQTPSEQSVAAIPLSRIGPHPHVVHPVAVRVSDR